MFTLLLRYQRLHCHGVALAAATGQWLPSRCGTVAALYCGDSGCIRKMVIVWHSTVAAMAEISGGNSGCTLTVVAVAALCGNSGCTLIVVTVAALFAVMVAAVSRCEQCLYLLWDKWLHCWVAIVLHSHGGINGRAGQVVTVAALTVVTVAVLSLWWHGLHSHGGSRLTLTVATVAPPLC